MQINIAFKNYLRKWSIGQNEFARTNGIDQSLLSRYIAGSVKIPLHVAVKIERVTKGEVPAASWVEQ